MKSLKSYNRLTFPWPTQDPFMFCAFHNDQYPKGNPDMGPDASLTGHALGQDFGNREGWNMYHGKTVPGFPSHPHCGFETVTIVEEGLVDHSDSLGAAARFGNGDVQWITAGKGLQHSEMFPLLNTEKENPFLLFQIWLNLPRIKKKADPYFKMLWAEDIPTIKIGEESDEVSSIKLVAGTINGSKAIAPAPNSWAADPENAVTIAVIRLAPNAKWVLPATTDGLNQRWFYYKGESINVDDQDINSDYFFDTRSGAETIIVNGNEESHLLFLQGKPINEPIAQYGPFVANTQAEIREAVMEYQKTEFGGWPWPKSDQVHEKSRGRFAKYVDGSEEERH